ncbi:MAG: DUF1571 domain-containing protein [Myxococcota bacterium]
MSMLLPLLAAAHAATAADYVQRMGEAWRRLSAYRTEQTIQERVKGDLGVEQRMRTSFRKPWEIQIAWETVYPGRKVYWCACRNDGDVLVYPGGLTGRALGVLSLGIDNPILRRETNYSLAQAGFGYLVEKFSGLFPPGASTLSALGEPRPETISGEPAMVFTVGAVEGLPYGGAELAVSERTHLPVRLVAWGRDRELAERFTWLRTEVDPKLDDGVDFDLAY